MNRQSLISNFMLLCGAVLLALSTTNSIALAQSPKGEIVAKGIEDNTVTRASNDMRATIELAKSVAQNDEFGTFMVPIFRAWLDDGVNKYGVRFLKPFPKPARLQIVQYKLGFNGDYTPLGQLNIKLELSGGLQQRQYEDAAETFANPRQASDGPIMSIFFLSSQEGGIVDAAIIYQNYLRTFAFGGDFYTDYSVKGLGVNFSGRFSPDVPWRYVVVATNGNVIDASREDDQDLKSADGINLKVTIRSTTLYGELNAVSVILTNRYTGQVLFAPYVTTIGQTR